MRYIQSYIRYLLLLLPLLYSCNSELDTSSLPVPPESVVVSFYISRASLSSEASTRTVDVVDKYENIVDISQLKIKLLVNNQPIDFTRLNIYPSDTELGVYQAIGEVDLPAQYLNTPASYRMEVFANCGTPAMYDPTLIYPFDRTKYSANAGVNTKYIPMWGVNTQTLTLKPGIRTQIGNIHLLRALSKIEFNLSDALMSEYEISEITLNQYNQQGYCLPFNSALIAQTTGSPTQTNIPGGTSTLSNLPFYLYQDKAYAYLPESADSNPLSYTIRLRNKLTNKTKNYSMTFNPNQLSTFQKVLRNKIYRYSIKKIKETEEIDCSYTIREWTVKDTNVETDEFHWLWVKDDTLYMNNISTMSTIFDSSTEDLVCTVSNQTIYSLNTPWPGSEGNATASATVAQNGQVTVNSPVPGNFVGKEFIVTVSSAISGKSAIIKVYQFPPLYISSTTTGVTWSDPLGQTTKNMYTFTALLPDLSTLPLPDEDSNYNTDTSVSNDYNYYGPANNRKKRWDLGVTYTNHLRTNCAFGFPRTTTSILNNFTSSCTAGASSAKNYTTPMTLLTTASTTENNRLISPRFMLASQAGMNIPVATYNTSTEGFTPKQYCERYREFDNQGNDYPPGSWRAPTRAEVYLIDILQNFAKCSVKKILEGGAYFGGDEIINIMIDPRTTNSFSTAAIRCVRDIK